MGESMEKIKPVKLTNTKWLNLFERKYSNGIDYFFASRRSADRAGTFGEIDAVRILPYFEENGKKKVVAIRSYRFPLEDYTFELPAGIKEYGEDALLCAKREVSEEIGAEVEAIEEEFGGLSGPGLTDEYIRCYVAKVKLNGTQHLEKEENIEIKVVDFDDIPGFCEANNFCLQSKLMMLNFYYKNKKD